MSKREKLELISELKSLKKGDTMIIGYRKQTIRNYAKALDMKVDFFEYENSKCCRVFCERSYDTRLF